MAGDVPESTAHDFARAVWPSARYKQEKKNVIVMPSERCRICRGMQLVFTVDPDSKVLARSISDRQSNGGMDRRRRD